jgi:hypothetical protein
MRIKLQSENLKGRDHLGDLGVDGRIPVMLKMDIREVRCENVDGI